MSATGKLCLQHEDLIHKYLPVFAREMEEGKEVAVRNNVVVIMCDLCVRYTNMVDHYIPNISACLGDNEAIIREQTLIMLTNLLQVGTDQMTGCRVSRWTFTWELLSSVFLSFHIDCFLTSVHVIISFIWVAAFQDLNVQIRAIWL